MQFALLGWPEDGPTLRLDYRRFSYAGKFVMSTTGKAVVRDPGSGAGTVGDEASTTGSDGSDDGDGSDADDADDARTEAADADEPAVVDPAVFEEDVLAAAAFNEDRTDPGVLWIRYIDVADTRRGESLGTRLALFVRERATERGYRRLRIAVNNPFSYEALYKAGFGYTGRQTGLAELVLEYPAERDRPTYQCGLDVFRERDLDSSERDFLDRKEGMEAPSTVETPPDGDVVEGADVEADRDPDADLYPKLDTSSDADSDTDSDSDPDAGSGPDRESSEV